jgi:hypothetical protein
MAGHASQRYQQRPVPVTSWKARGSDPATTRQQNRPSTAPPGWSAPPRRGRTSRRRRLIRPAEHLVVRPMRRLLLAYVRALVRAAVPWLLPLGILAVVSGLILYLGGH